MNFINQLVRDDLRDFVAYSSARDEAKQGKIWLNANELPYYNLNRYPDKQPAELLNLLANNYGVENSQCLMTRGSDEAIDLLIRLFCQFQRDSIIVCPPTFGMYEVSAKLQGINVINIPLQENDYQPNLDAIINCIDDSVKILFLCSPNNPTGNVICEKSLDFLCEKLAERVLIVVDEAYIEFSDTASFCNKINQYPNLVILRTLSKAFGLAAARIGVLIANANIIQWLIKIMPPYPLATPSINAAVKALLPKDSRKYQKIITEIKNERIKLASILAQLSITRKIWPSEGNFILASFNQSIELACQQKGVILRNMSQKMQTENCMRITLGTPKQNKFLTNVLRTL